jgi:hypothetical protein
LTEFSKGEERMEQNFEEAQASREPVDQVSEEYSPSLPEREAIEPKRTLIDSLPSESVQELCVLFGCTREALEAILSTSSGDPAHIISLVQSLSPAFIAIKLRFETRKRGELGGAACIIAKGSSGEFLDQTLWVSSRELPSSFSINADWEAVRNGIQKIGNNPDRGLFPKILKVLRDVFSPTAVNALFSSPSAKEKIITSLEKAFVDLYHNEAVVEMKIETFNRARLEMAGLGEAREPVVAEKTPEPAHSSLPGSVGTIQILCKPLLDPVKGKAVSDLVPGDLLVVEIEKSGGLSGIITKILDRAGEQPIFPVISVEKLPSGQSLIKLSVSKGIEGVAKIGADLRLKTAPVFLFSGPQGEVLGIVKKFFMALLFFFGGVVLLYWIFRN